MRAVPSWESYWMHAAFRAAERSKDPGTQVGAVLVDGDRNPIMTGYNGFAPGAPETLELWTDRALKYPRAIHAELNAIARCAKVGRPVGGATLYVTHLPCPNCALVIAAAGVRLVIAYQRMERWNRRDAQERLDEAGIGYRVDRCGLDRLAVEAIA